MRKLSVFLVLMLFMGFSVMAQRTVSGTVTSSEDGNPIPGATIVVKGTTLGTTSDIDGKYSLTVKSDAEFLIFRFVGMVSKEVSIPSSNTLNVSLEPDILDIEGVVVTALGITREKKALGYSVQDVKGDELTKTREDNVINALSGKISGVSVSSSNGAMGGSSRILIRGANSVLGDNQPLFVVDGVPIDNQNFTSDNQARGSGGYDYGNAASDINPDDIASISVLKGASAAALYGSRAANGVIIITTKSGKNRKGKKGIGVSFNSGVFFDQVSVLPSYQNLYGGGGGAFDTLFYDDLDAKGQALYMPNGGYYTDPTKGAYDLIPAYSVDESWGPKLDQGTMVRHWDSWDSWDSENYGKNREWASNPENVQNFFKTGVTINNSVALSSANETGSFRLSYNNVNKTGIMPNSDLQKNSLNFNGSTKLGKRINVSTSFNYVRSEALGRPGTGYDGNNVMQQFNQWGQRQVDMGRLEAYENPDGSGRTWNRKSYYDGNPKFTDSPYWVRNNSFQNDYRNRLFGNAEVTYKLTNYLSIQGRVNGDLYTDVREERIAVGSQATPFYSEAVRQVQDMNYEWRVNFNKQVSDDLGISAFIGGNRRDYSYRRNIMETQDGLSVPNIYNLANSVGAPDVDDHTAFKTVNSLYGSVSVDFRRTLFVDATIRNDWSSTLPEAENSYLYPSITSSFVFTELGDLKNSSWFSFGKLRASWAKVGNDTDPYNVNSVYNLNKPYGSYPNASVSATLNNPNLKAESTISWEVGTDLQFFNKRVAFDATYYSSRTIDQILELQVSPTTGYRNMLINAGEMTNKGFEMMLTGVPVRTKDFTWEIYANFARNENELVSLMDGLDNLKMINAPFAVTLNALVGSSYGAIMGRNFVFDDNGDKVIGDNGLYLRSPEIEVLGNVLPDWTAGVGNSFDYKGLSLSFLFDFQKGGSFFSTDYMWGMYSGILEETAADNIRDDGIVLEGPVGHFDDDGVLVIDSQTNDVIASASDYSHSHYSVNAMNVFDASYIKLREVSIGYSLSKSLISNTPFTNVRVSAVGRNLFMFNTSTKHFDPQQATNAGNIQGIQGGQLPSTRTYGFNISLNL